MRSRTRRACCASTRSRSISRGLAMALCTTLRVISLKVTRRALSSGRFSSSFRCQLMASPSRSGSVARYTVFASLERFFSSSMTSLRAATGIYSGAKPFSMSTPSLFLGRSRRCPMEAITLYCPPRYFSIVRAFAGDSTITRSFFACAICRKHPLFVILIH